MSDTFEISRLQLDTDLLEELQKDANKYTGGDLAKMINCRLRLAQFVRPEHGQRDVRVKLRSKNDTDYRVAFDQMNHLQSNFVWIYQAHSLSNKERVIELTISAPG